MSLIAIAVPSSFPLFLLIRRPLDWHRACWSAEVRCVCARARVPSLHKSSDTAPRSPRQSNGASAFTLSLWANYLPPCQMEQWTATSWLGGGRVGVASRKRPRAACFTLSVFCPLFASGEKWPLIRFQRTLQLPPPYYYIVRGTCSADRCASALFTTSTWFNEDFLQLHLSSLLFSSS